LLLSKEVEKWMKVDNLVLGAGISGLAYAHEKVNSGKITVVFEAESYYGGLCHSFEVDEFRFDSAIHLSFTNNPEARKLFDKTPYCQHKPISYNYYHGLWLKHPVLNNLFPMDVKDKVDCIQSFINRKEYKEIKNYGEWLRASYGDVIAEKFYYVYTRKYWAAEPEEMSTTWIGNRLNIPDLESMLYGSFTGDTGNYYYAQEMRYPNEGGYKAFLIPLLEGVKIEYNKRATAVDIDEKYVEFSDGTCCYFNKLISSIPLPELVRITKNLPNEIYNKVNQLEASKISLVSIGFNKPNIPKYLWMYIYDEDILAARINSPSLKSINNVPKGCSSMQFEIYHRPNLLIDKNVILENTKNALLAMHICTENDIAVCDYKLLPYGNVIHKIGMEQNRDIIKSYFVDKDIELIGRFGEWEYFWSDQSYMSGVKKAHGIYE
jgi:protoporphyrinogen oxidase